MFRAMWKEAKESPGGADSPLIEARKGKETCGVPSSDPTGFVQGRGGTLSPCGWLLRFPEEEEALDFYLKV